MRLAASCAAMVKARIECIFVKLGADSRIQN